MNTTHLVHSDMVKRKKSAIGDKRFKKGRKDGGDLISFILQFVVKHELAHIDVVNLWADHANTIGTHSTVDKDVTEWMGFVKNKIGAPKYYEIRNEYDNFCKKDCGFTKSTDAEMEALVEEMCCLT